MDTPPDGARDPLAPPVELPPAGLDLEFATAGRTGREQLAAVLSWLEAARQQPTYSYAEAREWVASLSAPMRRYVARHPLLPLVTIPAAEAVRCALADQAYADGAVVWDPVCDLLVVRGIMPSRSAGLHLGRPADAAAPEWKARLAPLGAWVTAQTDPDAIRPLLRFQASFVLQCVTEHLRTWDESLLRALLDRHDFVADTLLPGPLTAPALATAIVAWGIGAIGDGHNPARSYQGQRAVIAGALHGGDLAEAQRAVLRGYLAPRHPRRVPVRLVGRTQLDADQYRYQAAIEALTCAAVALTEVEMHAILDHAQHDSGALVRLVHHPAATVSVWERIATVSRATTVREALAACGAVRSSDVVRALLVRSNAPDVLESCCDHLDGADFLRTWRKLARLSLNHAGAALRRREPERFDGLTRADLTPILQHGDEFARDGALRAFEHLPRQRPMAR